MSSLYCIFVLILMFTFQWSNGQGRSVVSITEENNVNGSCLGNETYCCSYAAVNTNNSPEENHELPANTPMSSNNKVLFGPFLIVISLLVLRALSKRVEE